MPNPDVEQANRWAKLVSSYMRVSMDDAAARVINNSIKVACKACGNTFPLVDTVFRPDQVHDHGEDTYVAAYMCKECRKPQDVIDFVKGNKRDPWLP